MKIIIIGNGSAGTAAGQTIRRLDNKAEITMISTETHTYYARPRLPEIIAGKSNPDNIIVFKQDWYKEKNINLILNTSVTQLNPQEKKVILSDGKKLDYDKLLLATGAEPNHPPIQGINDHKNIFILRTMDDALEIKKTAAKAKDILSVGGGLLGLEVIDSLANGKRKIKIIEYFESLLPRQLSSEKGYKLQKLLETKNYDFFLGKICSKIHDNEGRLCIETTDGNLIEADMIILAAGVKARIELAKDAGLETEKGIKVNEYLQTTDPNIYAAGDCIQLEDKLWGWVKSAIEQGNYAAENIIKNNNKEYPRTIPKISLKITGIDINSL